MLEAFRLVIKYGGKDRDSKCILHIYTGQCVPREIDFADTCQIQIDIQDLLANSSCGAIHEMGS